MRFIYLGTIGLLSGVALASPAPSVNLTVGGAITPGVCNVTFDNGGALDFGAYGYQDLDQENWTVLPQKGVRLDVSCGRATTAVMDVVDNVADPSQADGSKFSLGHRGDSPLAGTASA